MTLEQDNVHASSSWSDPNAVSWDADPLLMDPDEPSTPPLLSEPLSPAPVAPASEPDEEEWVKQPLFSKDSLRRVARQLSPVLVPLPFALLIFLFSLPVELKGQQHLPVPVLVIVLLALVVMQGTALYYAGSNDTQWTLYTILGYALFLLVGAFALFGTLGVLLLLIILLLAGMLLGGRAIKQVPEGSVDLVFSFSAYQRTLFPGLNFILPWEKIQARLNTQETTWTSPPVQVSVSRDQYADIVATLTYQLVPEDAHIAYLNMQDWQKTLQEHCIGTLKSIVQELSPADFVAWSHHVNDHAALVDEDFPDIATMTRWDRLNIMLRSRLQDQMAMRGILINLAHVQDVTLQPHLPPASSPPPGWQNWGTEPAQADTGATRSPGSTVQPAAYPAAAPPAQSPAPKPVPKPEMFSAMILTYNLVREGRMTDIQMIEDLAERFEAIASHPEISQQFDYDAGRAAYNLRAQARALRAKAAAKSRASDPDDTTEVKRPVRRAFNDNLAAGG